MPSYPAAAGWVSTRSLGSRIFDLVPAAALGVVTATLAHNVVGPSQAGPSPRFTAFGSSFASFEASARDAGAVRSVLSVDYDRFA